MKYFDDFDIFLSIALPNDIESFYFAHKNDDILAYYWLIKMFAGLHLVIIYGNLACVLAFHWSFALYDVIFYIQNE